MHRAEDQQCDVYVVPIYDDDAPRTGPQGISSPSPTQRSPWPPIASSRHLVEYPWLFPTHPHKGHTWTPDEGDSRENRKSSHRTGTDQLLHAGTQDARHAVS